MAAVILEVLEYKREKVNGTLMDKYKMKLKDGVNIYETIGFRLAFPLVLQAGQLLENMRAVGELSQEDFAKEWYEAKEIEDDKLRKKENTAKVEHINPEVTSKSKISKNVMIFKPKIQIPEQLSLF